MMVGPQRIVKPLQNNEWHSTDCVAIIIADAVDDIAFEKETCSSGNGDRN